MTNLLTSSSIQKRIAVGVMAIAMFFGVFAFTAPVEAQTMTEERRAELQAQIDQLTAVLNALIAQIAALQGQVSAIDEVPAPVENTLEDVTIRVEAEDDTAYAGQTHQSVLGMWLSATDRDYDVTKLFLSFENESGDNMSSPYPWDTFETISLWVEGDKVAEFDVSAQSDWPYYGQEKGDRYVLPLEGLDFLLDNDASYDLGILVAATIKDSAEGQTWKFGVSDVRFEDRASDLVMQFGNESQLPVRVLGEDFAANLDITKSSNSPDGSMIQVDQDDDSAETEVFVINIEETNGVDVEIDSLSFEIDYSGSDAGIDQIFDEAILVLDGAEIGSIDVDDDTLIFEDLGIYLEGGEDADLSLELVFQGSNNYDNGGDYVFFTVSFEGVEEAEDDLGNTEEKMGSTVGFSSDEFILATGGLSAELYDESVSKENTGESAIFEMEVAVTAFGGDLFVPKYGYLFEVVDSDGNEASGATSYVVSSNADEDSNNMFIVEEGRTEYIQLAVDFTPENTGLYRLVLSRMSYYDEDGGLGFAELSTSEFKTDAVLLDVAGGTDPVDVVEDPADDTEVIDDPADDPVDEPVEDSTEDPSGNDEEDTTPTGEKVYARVVVEQAAKAKGTYHGKQAKLANGNIKKNGEWFWLTNNGEFVKDSVGPRSVAGAQTFPGVTVSRSGNGEFRIGLIGNNKDGSMTEFSEGYIEIKGPAKIVEVGKVKTEKHSGVSTKYNTKLMVDYITKASKTRANFGLAVSTGVDILVVKVEPTGEVLGASTADELAAALDSLDAALSSLEATVLPESQVLGASTSRDSYGAWSNSIDDLAGALAQYLK